MVGKIYKQKCSGISSDFFLVRVLGSSFNLSAEPFFSERFSMEEHIVQA